MRFSSILTYVSFAMPFVFLFIALRFNKQGNEPLYKVFLGITVAFVVISAVIQLFT